MADIDIASLGTILGVWAHPDDESFMMAGLMAMAVQNGQTVACITATKGEMGSQDEVLWPSATLGAVRALELKSAFSILGVKHHTWLDYPDGDCKEVSEKEAVDKIITIIHKYKPDTVVTFPPDGITGHHDHVAVSRWTHLACAQSGRKITLYYGVDTIDQYENFIRAVDERHNVYFNIDHPTLVDEKDCDMVLRLNQSIVDLKLKALLSMPSQTEAMISDVGSRHMAKFIAHESYVLATRNIKWGTPRL